MKYTEDFLEDFRAWLRGELKQAIEDDPKKVGFVLFPVKKLVRICIEESAKYLEQIGASTLPKTIADLLGISKKTVQRAKK